MTVLFAGSELTSFLPSDPALVLDNTATTAARDTAYSRAALSISQSTSYADGTLTASATTCWWHGEVYIGASSASQALITLFNSSAVAVFRLYVSASSTLQMQYWNGSAWTNIGATWVYSGSTRYTFDMKVVCGSSGVAEFYVGGTLITSGTATMTSVTNIAKMRLSSNSSSLTYYSQVIAADESTIGWKLPTLAPTGNSATNTAWTGDYTGVDEAVLDDVDTITSASAGGVETFTMSDAPTLSGYAVKAVVVSMRARNAATGPQNIQAAVRSAAANYFSGTLTGIGTGYAPLLAVFATDPATSAAWTLANANAAELGVKSVA